MHRACLTLASVALMLSPAPLLAEEGVNRTPPFSKRQLADCMTRRMYANRTLSYYDAAKACKDQLRGKTDAAALKNPPKPVS
jgi:hypothetical protein